MRPLVCVMGVSAAGKSTVGAALAEALGVPFVDADALHSDSNRNVMAAGVSLTDDDRWSWLDAVASAFVENQKTGLVVACSALRRVYRDRIRLTAPDVVFVHLAAPREVLAVRAAARTGHFMPAALLDSQFDALEPLDEDEKGITVDASLEAHLLVPLIATRLDAS